jgi:hypothetical protein
MSSQETDLVSPTEVTPELGKGLWTLGGLLGLSRRPASASVILRHRAEGIPYR